ncbi:MAG: preprotein translocase subunit SecY [Candidatus Taylorbacteria bacterium]|nr:preprotein translocase subunit SecY [Candidatus Taylorbacteria bacterium]
MNFLSKLKLVFTDPGLRRRILFTLGILAVFRLLAAIPIPGADLEALEKFFENNQFFGLINLFSGGGLANLSIVMLGVGPYITASIIMQLLTMISPKLKQMYHEEGEAGRQKFTQYSRLLTVPLAVIQALGFLVLLTRQGIVPEISGVSLIINIIVIAAGSIFLMWLGELVTEFGIGNGVSLLIFAGIVADLPRLMTQAYYNFNAADLPVYAGFLAAAAAVIYGVVVVTEAERPIPVTYAKRVRGMKLYGGLSTYLPLRINQAGVIPIIFALSILLLPQMLFKFLEGIPSPGVQGAASFLFNLFSNGWFYSIFYFALVFLFTYFYTAVTFDPAQISENLQKSGAFIPGVRPGRSTAEHITRILTRITLVGAVFLGFIAVLPLAMQAVTGNAALAIGGTGLLIVVSVVLDLIKRVDAQVSMREY